MKTKIICVKCGRITRFFNGSLKHPYCLSYFPKQFDTNLQYMSYMESIHE